MSESLDVNQYFDQSGIPNFDYFGTSASGIMANSRYPVTACSTRPEEFVDLVVLTWFVDVLAGNSVVFDFLKV